MTRTPASWMTVALVALALTGCGGESAGEAASEDPERQGLPKKSIEISDQPGSVDSFVGAIDDATIDRCEAVETGWSAAGTVTNPTDDAQNYRIYVSYEEQQETKGLVQVDLTEVAAGATEEWTSEVRLDASDVTCILRVERFDP